MSAQHTPGPWRWEVNEQHKTVHLVGGKPQFDLTIIDFERWGMHRATMRLRDPAHDGMNLMDRCTTWAVKAPGREHHASWFKLLSHPDARLIEAAPELLGALEALVAQVERGEFDHIGADHPSSAVLLARAAIAKATGEAA